jgi:hypothetical protein
VGADSLPCGTAVRSVDLPQRCEVFHCLGRIIVLNTFVAAGAGCIEKPSRREIFVASEPFAERKITFDEPLRSLDERYGYTVDQRSRTIRGESCPAMTKNMLPPSPRSTPKLRSPFAAAKSDDVLGKEYGLFWLNHLLAPAGEEGHYTTNADGFFSAQHAWARREIARVSYRRAGRPAMTMLHSPALRS